MNNNDNSFALFVNNNKQKENQPDYTGRLTINGQNYRIAGWKRVKQETGLQYLAGRVELEQEAGQYTQTSVTNITPKPKPSNDDDIPF